MPACFLTAESQLEETPMNKQSQDNQKSNMDNMGSKNPQQNQGGQQAGQQGSQDAGASPKSGSKHENERKS
jgi:hypothetical protein